MRRHKLILAAAALTEDNGGKQVNAGSTWTFTSSGNWSVSSNWLGGVPGNTADAHIVHSDLFSRTITYDYTGSAVTLGTLEVSNGGVSRFPQINTLSQSAHTLTAGVEYIGTSGNGAYNQSGGTNTFNNSLQLGELASSNGSYSLSAGTLNGVGIGSTSSQYTLLQVGALGAGTFNQSGGTVSLTANSELSLGVGTAAAGTYLLSGNGVLTVFGIEDIGSGGKGTFIQTGGTNSASSGLGLGDAAGGSGTYSLGNGTGSSNALLNVGEEDIGSSGAGTFIHTGGTNTVSQIIMGDSTIGGIYLLGNGTAASSAVLNSQTETIGHAGSGTFIQTGGTHTIANGLILGDLTGSGTYALSSGILNVGGDEYIGKSGFGAFTQSGGTHTVGSAALPANLYLAVGNLVSGTRDYTLSGTGQAIVHGNLYMLGSNSGPTDGVFGSLTIGGSGSAGGGSMTITGLLKIWNSSIDTTLHGNIGVNLGTGGFLSIGSLDTTAQPSHFLWSAGTLQFSGNVEIGSLGLLGSSPVDNAAKTLVTAGDLSIESAASFNLSVGALIVASGSTAGNHGVFNQTGGSLTVNGAFVNSATANFGGPQAWGPASVFINLAGVSTFSTALNSSGFGPVVVVTGGTVNADAPATLPRLSVTSGMFNVAAGRTNVLRTSQLAIDTTGTVDLADNDLVTESTSLATVAGYIASAFNGGSWNGSGLTSSVAAASGAHRTALGYATASSIGVTIFDGQVVNGSDVLVRYTYRGDANLDGVVNALDFNALASNFGKASGNVWIRGDFNYDGAVNTLDFTSLASNFNQPALSSPALGTAVPETEMLAFPMLAGLWIRRRLKVCHVVRHTLRDALHVGSFATVE